MTHFIAGPPTMNIPICTAVVFRGDRSTKDIFSIKAHFRMETSSAAQEQRYIDTWKELLRGFAGMTGFAVFSHGSVVILKGAHHSEDAARAEAL